ncbi:hypothetical protein L9F63_010154, partial [Diploptera punctata]
TERVGLDDMFKTRIGVPRVKTPVSTKLGLLNVISTGLLLCLFTMPQMQIYLVMEANIQQAMENASYVLFHFCFYFFILTFASNADLAYLFVTSRAYRFNSFIPEFTFFSCKSLLHFAQSYWRLGRLNRLPNAFLYCSFGWFRILNIRSKLLALT